MAEPLNGVCRTDRCRCGQVVTSLPRNVGVGDSVFLIGPPPDGYEHLVTDEVDDDGVHTLVPVAPRRPSQWIKRSNL